MEELKNNTGQNLGIAALITAIITFVLAVLPCVGMIAIIPGIIAIVASLIAFSQVFVITRFAQKADKWPTDIQNIIKDVQDNVIKELEDNNVSIKIESNGEKVEINAGSDKKDKEQKLDDLEGGNTQKDDTIQTKK